MADASCIGYLALHLDVQQHLWAGGGGEANVRKGQVGEEELCGCVQVGVWADSQDEEQVPKHRHMERKTPNMKGYSSDTQWNLCIISWVHVVEMTTRKQENNMINFQ